MTIVTEVFERDISALKERQDVSERREAHLEGVVMFVDVCSPVELQTRIKSYSIMTFSRIMSTCSCSTVYHVNYNVLYFLKI